MPQSQGYDVDRHPRLQPMARGRVSKRVGRDASVDARAWVEPPCTTSRRWCELPRRAVRCPDSAYGRTAPPPSSGCMGTTLSLPPLPWRTIRTGGSSPVRKSETLSESASEIRRPARNWTSIRSSASTQGAAPTSAWTCEGVRKSGDRGASCNISACALFRHGAAAGNFGTRGPTWAVWRPGRQRNRCTHYVSRCWSWSSKHIVEFSPATLQSVHVAVRIFDRHESGGN